MPTLANGTRYDLDSVQFNQRKGFIGPLNQNDNNVLRKYLRSKHNFVTAASRGAPALWPDHGMTIWAGEGNVNITAHRFYENYPNQFSSFNYKDFNYVANGTWEDWVDLAKKILEIDQSIKDFNK